MVSGDAPEEPNPATPGAEDAAAVATGTAPKSLSPAAREAWKDLPEAVKTDIAKREADYEKGIVQYADNAKRAEAMDRSLAPFQQLFAMNGGGPQQTLEPLLQTASVLQMGSPQQKAQTAANLIKQFGVDIRMLDGMLVGEQPQQSQQDIINQAVQQAVAPYQQQVQQQKHQQQQAVNNEVNQFAAQNEFYGDVSDTMADLMEMAAKRGRELTMQDAYDQACRIHPQISQVLAGRQAQSVTAPRQNAAVSISGSPGGGGDSRPADSIRGQIEAAWELDGGRL